MGRSQVCSPQDMKIRLQHILSFRSRYFSRLTLLLVEIILLLPIYARSQNLANIGKTKPVTLSGDLSVDMNTYGSNDSVKTMDPFQWSVTGSPVLNIYGYSLPFTIFISSQNRSFNSPFTRFGVSPYYKWAKLHLGWQSLNFNQYTLGGQQILGGGFELTPGKLDIAFMYGSFDHAVTDVSVYNNLNNTVPVYNRSGYALKLGYGDEKTGISLSYLQAKDNYSSGVPTIIQQSGVTAAANQAVGLKGQLTFLKHFAFKMESALSFYTRDVNSDSVELKDQYKNNFFFKSGIISYPNASTSISTAGNASLAYDTGPFSLALQYKRIDPGYKSMGAFYLQTDVEQYTIAPALRLLKNKLFINGSLGLQRNNLNKQLRTSSFRKIGMLDVSLNPSQVFGMDLQYSNYGISQQVLSQYRSPYPGVSNVYDSLRISEISQSLSISPHFSFVGQNNVQVFSLNTSLQNLKDNNQLNNGQNNYTTITATLNHDWQIISANWDINQTFNYIDTKTATDKIGSAGYTLSLTKSFVPSKKNGSAGPVSRSHRLAVTISGNYYLNLMNNRSNGDAIAANAGISYQFLQHQNLSAGIGWISNRPKQSNMMKRNELTTYLRYNFSF